MLDDLGLTAALEALCYNFSERTGIETQIEASGFTDMLKPEASTALYRVAQEAFNNVERHSGASRLAVRLWSEGARARLMISDNGTGFEGSKDGAADKTGLGLRNMQERMAHFRGLLLINSTTGTTLTAMLPNRLICRIASGPLPHDEQRNQGVADRQPSAGAGRPEGRARDVSTTSRSSVRPDSRCGLAIGRQTRPQVVLIDINMPKLSGIDAIELFKKELPEARVVMLSMHDSREYISSSVMHGASGYILKDVSTDEIVTAIETVAGGGNYFSSGVFDVLMEREDEGPAKSSNAA